ncbi:MAG: isoleucine--tRNA ligase [Alphaproteobacteria bacterium]|nr:isoleucine--tRNA ligase [Alphaproteobacteria bacterium]
MTTDYKETVFLPKTNFSMRANLPQKEPEILKSWNQKDLFSKMTSIREGARKFILHDGPPYANGPIHIGTAMNKILKDIVNRSYHMMGRQIIFIPGWDCHGLPIEWKIEEEYRKQKKSRHDISVVEFRKECRAYARKWIDVQREQFKRLGVWADWEHPYLTIEKSTEANIVREMSKFLLDGSLYRGERPVMWSVVEQTALAEAEIEHQDHKSLSIFVRFPIATTTEPMFKDAGAVIWTTTPWTIPANRGIAYGQDIDYVLIQIDEVTETSLVEKADKLIFATELLDASCQTLGITSFTKLLDFKGSKLSGTICQHPFAGQGYDFEVPMLAGDHVTTEAGTGLVHTAPAHGLEDFYLGQKHGLEVTRFVQGDGFYEDSLPLFGGLHVYKAGEPVCEKLQEAQALLGKNEILHSYPHSWRSKAPLIFRTTPQWFLSMEKTGIRDKALTSISQVTWIPEKGQRRIESMIESRPDWCLSRQRVWGVPLAIFIHKATGEPLRDAQVQKRIADIFEQEGADSWFEGDHSRFLGPEYNADEYTPIKDILDVWFDSGCSHAFVLEARKSEGLTWPADLYLEGSDQHRGWFHTSLLEACGSRGTAPYKTVLTHGYVLDDKGRKMSKSLGNVIDPVAVADEMGVEMLRLWVASSDVSEDVRIAKERMSYQQDTYRRLRNTLRYLLGGLQDFDTKEIVEKDQMPELEQWVLHRLREMDKIMRQHIENYDFQNWFTELHNFCSVDLSSFYFDMRKDVLYCDDESDIKRRSMRTVFHHLFDCLTTWMSPVLCFTAEEAWQSRYGTDSSVHLQSFPALPEAWHNEKVATLFADVRKYRRLMTGALEGARASGVIGSSLQAHIHIYDPKHLLAQHLDWAEIAITSGATLLHQAAPSGAYTLPEIADIHVMVSLATGDKCQRCWKVLEEVTGKELCNRCDDVVEILKHKKTA